MSKERARTRAEREAAVARRVAEQRAERERAAALRARRERRDLAWRRARLWRHGGAHKERWAGLATAVLIILLLTYFLTRSVGAVVLVVLVSLIAVPAAAALMFEKRSK